MTLIAHNWSKLADLAVVLLGHNLNKSNLKFKFKAKKQFNQKFFSNFILN
jgi:hypothetical protein